MSQKTVKISADNAKLFSGQFGKFLPPAQKAGNMITVGNLNFWRGAKFASRKISPPPHRKCTNFMVATNMENMENLKTWINLKNCQNLTDLI